MSANVDAYQIAKDAEEKLNRIARAIHSAGCSCPLCPGPVDKRETPIFGGPAAMFDEDGERLSSDDTADVWTFESVAVAKVFDQHVREQLPWYDTLSQFAADILVSFIPQGGVIYDIGASTGNMTKRLESALRDKDAHAVSVEPSKQMCELWEGYGDLKNDDILNFECVAADVLIMFLTLMFIPPSVRNGLLRRLLEGLDDGGVMLIVDKGYLACPAAQVACKAATVAEKRRQGTPADAYMQKEISLRGEQRPTSITHITKIANELGCQTQEVFRFGEFYGLLLVKASV